MTSIHSVPFQRCEEPRLGLLGCGERGLGLLRELLALDGIVIGAVADINETAVLRAVRLTENAGMKTPKVFYGVNSWRWLVDQDLDMIYIATPWNTHTEYSVAVMKSGKHAAIEVPAATTLDECWQLVETSESTRKHCVMLENCCYDYWETLVKRMVFAGLFGNLVHAECAYNHDLRSLLLAETSEGLWRRQSYQTHNGNLYPTHGLGPVAQCLQIGELDAFEFLVSVSSLAAGLAEYRGQTIPAGDYKRDEVYINGDMNVSLIRTRLGRTIVLQHNTVTPRPYDRIFLISGTRGIFRDYPPRLFLEGVGVGEEWLPLEEYKQRWEDPLWTNLGDLARKRGGHGGMDFLMNYRLIQTLREGLPPDSDVYDAADWSAPGPLSEVSVARRSAAVDFPDFRNS